VSIKARVRQVNIKSGPLLLADALAAYLPHD
jgi:hypothetical protein